MENTYKVMVRRHTPFLKCFFFYSITDDWVGYPHVLLSRTHNISYGTRHWMDSKDSLVHEYSVNKTKKRSKSYVKTKLDHWM